MVQRQLVLFIAFAGIGCASLRNGDVKMEAPQPRVDAAARDFDAANFDGALTELRSLAAEYPSDPEVLQYLGRTLEKLGKEDEAIEVYKRAIATAPEDAALHSLLGKAYERLGRPAEQREELAATLRVSPDSKYGRLARDQLRAAPDSPRFDMHAEAGGEYDSNVALAPNDRGSFLFLESVDGSYSLRERSRSLNLIALASAFQSEHVAGGPSDDTESSPRDFDMSSFFAGLQLVAAADLWGKPVEPKLGYGYGYQLLGYAPFNAYHALETQLPIWLTPSAVTTLGHEFEVDDFHDESMDPSLASRDAVTNTISLSEAIQVSDDWQARARYGYRINEARGDSFDYHAHQAGVGVTYAGPWKDTIMDVGLDYSYAGYENYRRTLSDGIVRDVTDRHDNVWQPNASFQYQWGALTLSLAYRMSFARSSQRLVEYESHGGGLQAAFSFNAGPPASRKLFDRQNLNRDSANAQRILFPKPLTCECLLIHQCTTCPSGGVP